MIFITGIRKIQFEFPKDKGLSEEIHSHKVLIEELNRYSFSALISLVMASRIENKEVNDRVWDSLYKGYSNEEMKKEISSILKEFEA